MKTIFVSMFSLVALLCVEAGTLESQLMEKKNTPSAKSNPETRKIYEAGIVAVRESGVVEKVVQVGQKVPDFTLKNAKGEAVMLSELLKAGPVVLTWYRGGWCPYCNITLAAMQKVLPEIKEAGAQLVALTPELPDKSLSTREKNGLTFEVLTDLNHGVAKAYGVAFELTPEVAAKYQEHFNLLEFNGKEAGDNVLPLAATYVIDQEGVVRWGFLDADYRKRAEPAEVVAFLKGGMKGK